MSPTTHINHTTLRLIGGAVIAASLALLAGCELTTARARVAVVANRSDETVEEPATTVPPTTEVPATDIPAVTLPLPATTVPAPVVPAAPAVPAGAVDLGNGVFVVPSGAWTVTLDGDVVRLTDGVLDVSAQVLQRTPGEHPKVIMDEYVAGFEPNLEAVSFTPATLRWSADAPRPVVQYGTYYTTFFSGADDGRGLAGGLSTYARGDGLTLLFDIWGPGDTTGILPDDIFNSLLDSFLAAPEVATPVALVPVEDFRVASINDPATVSGLVGFTPAPGFTVLVANDGSALVSSGKTDFAAFRLTGVTDSADALRRGQAVVLETHPDATFVGEVNYGADEAAVVRHGIAWNGTFNGLAWGGGIDVFFDPSTGSAYLVYVGWEWGAGETPPEQAATDFMFTSFQDSFTNVV